MARAGEGSTERVAIYGGSFDPPHAGHEALARAALELLALDRLWVVPAASPVHRRRSGRADGATTRAWLERVWADEPRIAVADWELARPTPTIETLRRFAADFPGRIPLLLLGSDAAAGIAGWIGYPGHRRLCNLAIFLRAGAEGVRVPAGWRRLDRTAWIAAPNLSAGGAILLSPPLPEVSATELRRRLRRGEAPRGAIPAAIAEEVAARYRDRTNEGGCD